jgi:crotonobetainyl-CoA:carnitine CoA-transferase CaiB-like acyl-CoA transferase
MPPDFGPRSILDKGHFLALLGDLTIVEMPGPGSVAYCAKLFADAGARVLKVEPPEGDSDRARPGPSVAGSSAHFLAFNTGKTSRVVDPAEAGFGSELDALISTADLLLLGGPGDDPYGAGERAAEWSERHPSLVVTQVTPFGAFGPRASWVSSALVQYASSCWMHVTGQPDREPLAPGGSLAESIPGVGAASASLMALWWRDHGGGAGQVVDISAQEVMLLCQPYLEVGYAYTGTSRTRNGMPFPMTIVRAADGYLGVNVLTQTQWELLCAYMGRPELIQDARLGDPRGRARHAHELTDLVAGWAADKERTPVFLEGQSWRIPLGYVPHLNEIRRMAPHQSRAFLAPVDQNGTVVDYPGLPFTVDSHRCAVAAAPTLADGPIDRVPGIRPRTARSSPSTTAAPVDGPLSGVRVVDLSMYWSGPLAADLLAQYGAEVIKVESLQRVDGWRGMAADPGIERSNIFNGVNLNKLGITLDLTSEAGRDLLKPLVQRADVLIENFSPRVMGNFGLTDEVLHGWRPNLIILSMPAFGQSGPWRDFVGFAPTIEQLSGLPELTGYPDGPPVLTGHSVADPCAGLFGAFAALAVLRHRTTTSGGAHIDLSQLEAMTSLLGPELVAEQLGGAAPRRVGNSDPDVSPSGCYPAAGHDNWIVITAGPPDAWAGLDAAAGRRWGDDPRFASPEARRRHAGELDRLIGAWTWRYDAESLAGRLQAHRVAAAPVATGMSIYHDAHLAARGSTKEINRAFVGPVRYPVLPFKFSRTPGNVGRAGPTLGQDNHAILADLLGVPEARLAALRADRVIGESIETV